MAKAFSGFPMRSVTALSISAGSASGEQGVSVMSAHDQRLCDDFDAAFPVSTTHEKSTYKALSAFYAGSTCQVPTALKAESNAVAYRAATYGPKPDATRLPPHERFRKGAEHKVALALRKHRRAERDPQLLEDVGDAVPSFWGCNVQANGANGLGNAASHKRRKMSRLLKDSKGLFNIMGGEEPEAAERPKNSSNAQERRPALAERPNPPAATAVTADVLGRSPALAAGISTTPRITPIDAYPVSSGSSFVDENRVPVANANTTLAKGKAPDPALHPSHSSVEDLPRPAFRPRGLSQSPEEFMQYIVDLSQSGVKPSQKDGNPLAAVSDPVEDPLASSATAPPPEFGASAAADLLRSGDCALLGAATSPLPEAGVPVDFDFTVPLPEEAPTVVEPSVEGPVAQLEFTQEEQEQFFSNVASMERFGMPVSDLQTQTSQQFTREQPQQSEQLQEDIPASQPLEQPQQQQGLQNLSAQGPQRTWDFQPLAQTGQQSQCQEQQMPVLPATVPSQQPANGPPLAMPQQPQPWSNQLAPGFMPQQFAQGYTIWRDPNDLSNLWVCYRDGPSGRYFWGSKLTGACLWADPVPQFPQYPPQPPRGPRGGLLRGSGRPRVSASAPVNLGSAHVSLSPNVLSPQSNGLLAAGSGGLIQSQPSQDMFLDPALQ